MHLRLHPDGARVLDEWRKYRDHSDEDQRLVAQVLRTAAEKRWQVRWHSYTDLSDPTITVVESRLGLTVHVRLWVVEDPEQFAVMRIVDEDPARAALRGEVPVAIPASVPVAQLEKWRQAAKTAAKIRRAGGGPVPGAAPSAARRGTPAAAAGRLRRWRDSG